ncbi:site-specific integrase [Streptococcus sp. NLN64]|uniref:tyrosine-type recombinase/integrase n=1 Tax=Streptococcus sp. NLN64 TaxID=2822799 RepID=UPI0018C9465A|nr:site-specific integrase [Streptococcus sp. NLN64]MBG9366964.1 site-specific integrase [Streptococcus sp. NLN64]
MKINQIKKKDGSTVYRASVYLGTDSVTGKQVTTKVSGRTKKELKEKSRWAILDFEKNGATRFQSVNINTYEELASLWWESYRHTVKLNTQLAVKSLLDNHVIPIYGAIKLSKLTTAFIQQTVNQLADKANKGQKGAFLHYHKIHALNKRILQYGVVLQVIPFNPAREVILPRNLQKAKRNKVKHFENEELKRFLDYLDSLDQGRYRYYYETVLYKFLLATGCRINEALALHWEDIDLADGVVSITKTVNARLQITPPKSKASERDIDIDSQTINMLKEYKKRQTLEAWQLGRTETVVFSDFINEYPKNRQLHRRLLIHFKRADVPDIGFHGFRHTHASLLLNSGIPYKELQHRLGHSNISVTMDVYSHLSRESAKKAVSLFEKAMGDL